MAPRTYTVIIEGTARDGQSWRTETTTVDAENDISAMIMRSLAQSFMQLTQGKAVYGKPGVGCRGPYEIDRITLTRVIPNDHDADWLDQANIDRLKKEIEG